MGLFSGQKLSQVRLVGDYEYPKYGTYWVRIDGVKTGKNRKNALNIIIDYTVVAIRHHQEPPPHHNVGDEACHYIKVSDSEYAQADWAGFIVGMFGCKVEELDNPEVRAACNGMETDDWASNNDPTKGPVQPMAGMVGELKVRQSMTKDNGPTNPSHPFSRISWVRTVPMAEVLKALTPDEAKRFFPAAK